METTQATANSVFQHHLAALGTNDLDEIMKDYTEHSELCTQEGEGVGIAAISSFYSYAFTLFPNCSTTLELNNMTAKGDKVYIFWSGDSPVVPVPFATDCFEIKEEKRVWQSTAFQMNPQ